MNHHCILRPGQKTLYNPDPNGNEAARAAEDLLEKAVARYAEDNLLVVRVREPNSNSLSISLLSGFPKGPLLPENDPGPEDVWKQFLWLCRRMAGTLRWAFRNVGRRDLLPSLPSHRCNLQGKGDVP